MALKRGICQWISEQPSTSCGLALTEPARLRAPQALELDPEPPLPFGWEKCFDLKSGIIFFKDASTGIRTAKDPRHSRLQQQQLPSKDLDSDAWRGLSRSLDTAASDASGDKQHERMDRVQRFRGFEPSGLGALDEKVLKWTQNYGSKKLPPLLSLKSTDSLPSLELSLRLDSSHARDSSSLQLPTSGDKANTFNERAGQVKLEELVQCRQNFPGAIHNMGPFPSNSMKVKEEVDPTSLCCGDLTPVLCNLSSSTFPASMPSKRKGTETPATSPLEQPEFRDLLGPKYAMGPFPSSNGGHVLAEPMPSSKDQLGGACTLDDVLTALERRQSTYETAVKNSVSMKGGNPNINLLPAASVVGMKQQIRPSSLLLLQPPSTTKVSSGAASVSPTTSDASSALSSKSSLHSSTSLSVMSFQGEELDDLGGHGSSAEAKPWSNMLPSSDPKVVEDGEAPSTLVTGGCLSCHMFVMQLKDNRSCPKCGKSGLLDIPRKRQKLETAPVQTDSRRSWDTSSSPSLCPRLRGNV